MGEDNAPGGFSLTYFRLVSILKRDKPSSFLKQRSEETDGKEGKERFLDSPDEAHLLGEGAELFMMELVRSHG